jgi:L-iditol 2-dehydrogenase
LLNSLPDSMKAAVYRGDGLVQVEQVPVPELARGEILLRVESCGVCHTDLKKVEYDLLPPPRIYGHETAGYVAAVGAGVEKFAVGDAVIAFHHIPCGHCFYCVRKLYAQCAVYRRVGITAGFEPAGGGFAQYVRVMDWIVERGVEKIPPGVSLDVASFVEPMNTVLKGIEMAALRRDELAIVQGQGPIGLLFTMVLQQRGIPTIVTDTMPERRERALRLGAGLALDPRREDLAAAARERTEGRGADVVFVCAAAPGIVEQAIAASRPGARIILFAQTSDHEKVEVSGASICKDERVLCGSYSASVDLQKESAALVFGGDLPMNELISHRVPLNEILEGFRMARQPGPETMKIIVKPQEWS